jgi:hypothetical protein
MLSVPLILVLGWVHALPLALLAYLARQVLMNMSSPIQDNFTLELVPAGLYANSALCYRLFFIRGIGQIPSASA